MSLSRARKRLLGSLYRKKKLKISEQHDDGGPRPLLRSMSPLPLNATPTFETDDPIRHLQSSTSLPDQLDQSGAMVVANVSSKSLSSIDALSPSLELYPFGRDSSSEYDLSSYVNSTEDLNTSKICPSCVNAVTSDSCNVKSCHSELHNQPAGPASEMRLIAGCSNDAILVAGCSNDAILVAGCSNDTKSNSSYPNDIQSTTMCLNDKRSVNVTSLPSEPVQQKLLEMALRHAQKIETSPELLCTSDNLNVDQQPCGSNPQRPFSQTADFSDNGFLYSDTNLNGKACPTSFNLNDNTDFDNRSATSMTEEGTDDVFYPDDRFSPSFKTNEQSQISNAFLNITPTNEIHGDCSEKESTNKHTLDKGDKSTDENYDKSQASCHSNGLQMNDTSIIKKIKFFETYSKNSSKSSGSNNGLHSIENIHKNKRVESAREKCAMTSSIHISGVSICGVADYEVDVTSGCKIVNPVQTVVNSRGFNRSGVLRQRLNFSRFRRSDSIPEVELACSCGELCDEECTDSVADVVMGDSDRRAPDVVDESRDEGIMRSQVCHHPQCTEGNNDMPLMLCRECDLDIHDNPKGSGHLVLDIKQKHQQELLVESTTQQQTDDQATSSPTPVVPFINGETNGGGQTADEVIGQGQKLPRFLENQKLASNKEMKIKYLMKKGDYNLDAITINGIDSPILPRKDSVTSNRTVERSSSIGSFSGSSGSHTLSGYRTDHSANDPETSAMPGSLGNSINRKKLLNLEGNGTITLRFCIPSSSEEDLVTVAATPSKKLWEAVGPVLEGRQLDINSVNVFLEKSQTPLPMECFISYLADNTLEIKEKEHKDLDPSILGTPPPSSLISWPKKGSKGTGRGSRRDSAGLASLLLDAPSTRQRRGSLQLHFRDHLFNKTEAKNQESSKTYDDSVGNFSGRKLGTSTAEDDISLPPGSAGSSSAVKRTKSTKLANRFGSTNKEKERQDQLLDLLGRYSVQGLPVCQDFDETVFEMEVSWKMFVGNHESMSKRQHEHQEAVWELLHTEVSYIKQIRFIIDVFQNCLMSVKQESYLNEIESERLFSNIDKVFECNCLFWQQHLLPVLQHSRETQKPLDPMLFKDAFVDHFPVLFQVYFKYLIEHKSCLDYAKTCMDNSELFKIFIQWAETQKQCNRLRLADILVQPMPRLLKYSLLLRAILKYTENDRDRIDLQAMIQSVDKLCDAANSSLRRREEYESLAAVVRTIEPFDSLEAPNDECAKIILEYAGNFNLLVPIPDFQDVPRSLLFQSNLKMKEGQNVKMDVDCLLFTDLLLICKSNKKIERYKIVRPPMRLDQLVVCELKDKGSFLLIYVNEYSVPLSAFTFHSDAGAIRGWLDKFRQAQREFKQKELHTDLTKTRYRSDTSSTQSEQDYVSMTSLPSYPDSLSSIIPRSDSVNSLDHIRPNYLATRDASFNASQSELARSSSLINFRNTSSSLSPQTNGPKTVADLKLVIPFNSDYSPVNEHRISSEPVLCHFQNKRTEVKMLQSPLDTKMSSFNKSTPIAADVFSSSPDDSLEGREEARSGSFSDVFSNQLRNVNHSQSQMTLYEQSRINDNGNLTKFKPSSRRTDKRYRTADEIPELKSSQQATSITEWPTLRMDLGNANPKNFDSIEFSTDSLQSYPSSSGVSSTGSLHFPVEMNEVSNGNVNDGIVCSDSCPTIIEHRKMFSVDDAGELPGMDDAVDGDCKAFFLSQSKHSKSKSTSDLVEVFSNSLRVSQLTDGIASVDMSANAFHRKLTQLDILRMKKMKHQILSDANTESSEV